MIQNWPMQSTAADILRLLMIVADDACIMMCAIIHGAVLIEALASHIEEAVAEMWALMFRAGRTAIEAEYRVGEPQIVHHHQRLYDKRQKATLPEGS
jgi:hypothetical protein